MSLIFDNGNRSKPSLGLPPSSSINIFHAMDNKCDTLNLCLSFLRQSNHAHSRACDVMQEEREDSKNIVLVPTMMGDGRVEIKLHSFLT